MKYQKIMICNTPNKPSKFRTKNWVTSNGRYNTNNQIKFKTSILKSSLFYFSDTYVLVNGTISAANTAATG